MDNKPSEQTPRPLGADELSNPNRLELLSNLVEHGAKLYPPDAEKATDVTGIRITPDQYTMAHTAMETELARRKAEMYLTADELAEGEKWHQYIESTVTPQSDGANFRLTAKFHSQAGVPGLDPAQLEWQTIIPDGEGAYRETTYRSQSRDFLFASAIQQSLLYKGIIDTSHRGANLLVTYPSPSNPKQTVCSYGMAFGPSNFPENEKNRTPSLDFASLDFEIPTTVSGGFIKAAQQNPRHLEALLQATPYGKLMHTANPEGPIVRVPADRLIIAPLASGAYTGSDATLYSKRAAVEILANADAMMGWYDPPIGP